MSRRSCRLSRPNFFKFFSRFWSTLCWTVKTCHRFILSPFLLLDYLLLLYSVPCRWLSRPLHNWSYHAFPPRNCCDKLSAAGQSRPPARSQSGLPRADTPWFDPRHDRQLDSADHRSRHQSPCISGSANQRNPKEWFQWFCWLSLVSFLYENMSACNSLIWTKEQILSSKADLTS